ncbi:reverse transcriptase domain-containing protein [Tanacetum coccineum]
MSNTNNKLQTQTSNALHKAIMEAGGKDCPPMLAPDNDIYSTVNACPNACEMWKAIERFYKMMNELVRNQCDVTNHQVNVQLLLQLQPEWKRFVTLVKQSQELKNVSYHKLYDILKQHHNKVNEIRAERLARTANPLALVAQPQQASTRNRGKAIINSLSPIYDQELDMVTKDDALSKEKEIDKLMALISLSFKAVNVAGARENVGTQVVQQSGIQCYNYKEFGHVVRECKKPKRAKDAAYHKEKILLCKQEEAGIQLSAEQVVSFRELPSGWDRL